MLRFYLLLLSFAFIFSANAAPSLPKNLKLWIDLEQHAIDRTVNTKLIIQPDIKNQNLKYQPESGEWFPIKTIWLPESEVNAAELPSMVPPDLESEFVRVRNNQKEYRLFIHPESENFYQALLKKHTTSITHEATSTASSRTVLVRSLTHQEKIYFVKLSLDVELGGVVRTIPSGEVARSIGTTQYLNSKKSLSPVFNVMPEILGICPKGWKRGGQIIRLIPERVLGGETTLVPMFSLYADRPGKETLLEMLSRKSGKTPYQFVKEHILIPFFEAWSDWAIHGGIVMEAHAQNFLLEISPDGIPTGRFMHRDLGGFNIDSASVFFDSAQKLKMPTFSTFEKDYLQKFSKAAQNDSISTYFNGGFLFNIDKKLSAIDPDYKKGDILKESKSILMDSLSKASSLPVKKIKMMLKVNTLSQIISIAQKTQMNGPQSLTFCDQLMSGFIFSR